MTFVKIFVACIPLSILSQVNAIKCFNCAAAKEIFTMDNEKTVTPSCAHFDGSATYIVDCPFSTMCSRIISTMYLEKGQEQRIFTLGCAQQKLSRYVLNNGIWKEEYSVEEIYSEDCQTMNDNNLVGATRTYCYCRGNLCNSAKWRNFSLALILVLSTLSSIIVA